MSTSPVSGDSLWATDIANSFGISLSLPPSLPPVNPPLFTPCPPPNPCSSISPLSPCPVSAFPLLLLPSSTPCSLSSFSRLPSLTIYNNNNKKAQGNW